MEYSETLSIGTGGFSDVVDITGMVQKVIADSGISDGLVCASSIGSTASITTIEFEPALVQDLKDLLERIAPSDMPSRHSETWGDDNGFSHLRASLMGPSVTVPVSGGTAVLGTWQQIAVVDHDNRPRTRRIRVHVSGIS